MSYEPTCFFRVAQCGFFSLNWPSHFLLNVFYIPICRYMCISYNIEWHTFLSFQEKKREDMEKKKLPDDFLSSLKDRIPTKPVVKAKEKQKAQLKEDDGIYFINFNMIHETFFCALYLNGRKFVLSHKMYWLGLCDRIIIWFYFMQHFWQYCSVRFDLLLKASV